MAPSYPIPCARSNGPKPLERTALLTLWLLRRDRYRVRVSRRCGTVGRRGSARATVATGQSILVATYYILDGHQPYRDLGLNYFRRRLSREHYARRLLRQIQALGYRVSLEEAAQRPDRIPTSTRKFGTKHPLEGVGEIAEEAAHRLRALLELLAAPGGSEPGEACRAEPAGDGSVPHTGRVAAQRVRRARAA